MSIATPRSLEDLISAAGRVNTTVAFAEFAKHMRMSLPGPTHQHVGILSGQRVQAFQNWLLIENYRRQLSDMQLLAIMRAEFPLAEGAVFTGTLEVGLSIVAGIRAHFNRDGHHGKSPSELGLPASKPTDHAGPSRTALSRRVGPPRLRRRTDG